MISNILDYRIPLVQVKQGQEIDFALYYFDFVRVDAVVMGSWWYGHL